METFDFGLQSRSLSEIFNSRDRWLTFPPCQRGKVWDINKEQLLIDSVLRGFPLPPLVVVWSRDELGSYYGVIDGQQRLRALMRFLENRYSTAKTLYLDRKIRPVFPGMTFSEMDVGTQAFLRDYQLPLFVVKGLPDGLIPFMFRRLQIHVPLTFAEKLWSYPGPAKEVGDKIEKHRFWRDVYQGKTDRRQGFQAAIYMILLELRGPFCNLTSSNLTDALGEDDSMKQAAILNSERSILRRLDVIAEIFDGSQVTAHVQVPMMYQAVMLLEDMGYKLIPPTNGVLAPWFNLLKEKANRDQQNGLAHLYAQLSKVNEQRAFWAEQLPVVTEFLDMPVLDKTRAFNVKQKLILWNRQDGKCVFCGKPMRWPDAVAHHADRHTDGGETDVGNGELVHKKCHELIHTR